jgi:predicted esterase
MKATLRAALALLLVTITFPAAAQAKKPAPTAPPAPGSAVVGASPQAPPGAKPATIQDTRLLEAAPADPWQLERLGVAAVQKNELGKAREFFEESWKAGELPTAPYNLACLDAREGKADSAFRQLDRAIAAGFDDEATLAKDSDLTPLRGRTEFARIVEGARRNRAAGDAAVVGEGIFVAPGRAPKAILLLLHEVDSDPMSVAGPFVSEAKERGLFVAAPRGPARSGKKRFGWGSPDRALEALKRAIAEARVRTGKLPLPVVVVGAGRGGKLGLEIAARTPGLFAAVGSVGGIFDPGPSGAGAVAGLKGVPVFLGVAKGAPPELYKAMKRGRENMEKLGVRTTWQEWPGTGDGLPKNATQAAKEILDALVRGRGAARPVPAPRKRAP